MFITVTLTFLLIVGVITFIYSLTPRARDLAFAARITGAVLVAAGLTMLAFSTITVVPARTVGVPITFGVPGDPLPNGLNFKAPWTKVELMPTTAQPLDASGENPTIARDADDSDVYVHNNVRWAIVEEHATSVYLDALDFDNVRDLLVQPELRTAISTVMANYDPLADDKPGNAEVADAIKAEMQRRLGERIEVRSVSVTLIEVSAATQDRINGLNTEKGNTRIAEQRVVTAKAQAEANRTLAESVANDPNVLVSYCLDLLAEGKTPPAGFQCWPGQADGSTVIVNDTPTSGE